MKSLIYGVGLNDANYHVAKSINGKLVKCPIYARWHNMLQRCYDQKWISRYPTYKGCVVCDDWLTFSNFKRWMEQQDWQGKELDKDLLVIGNKVYSPETCVFLDGVTNNFTTDRGAARGEWPIGVYFNKRVGKFMARCNNPFTRKQEHLGYFDCPSQSHQAWRKRKHELSCQLADLQTDQRVSSSLRTRYAICTLDGIAAQP